MTAPASSAAPPAVPASGSAPSPQVIALVEASVDPTALLGPELEVHAFNRAYAQLTGLRGRELRSKPLSAMCHTHFGLESCADPEGCVAKRAFAKKKPVRLDQVRGKDGMVLVVNAVPLLDEAGEPTVVVETYRDVTAESRMQESYRVLLERERHQNEILQEEVAKRTQDLSRSIEELKDARSHLIRSEKMSSLGLLVAGIAHELNNPISFVYANLEFVETHARALLAMADALAANPAPEVRAAVAEAAAAAELDFIRKDLPALMVTLNDGCERVARIVADLRVFSHGGKAKLEPYDLDAGITMTLRIVKAKAQDRVALVPELGKVPLFECQGAHINQVLLNLVVNAVQAIEGPGTVWVRSRKEGTDAVIEVQDTGPGIPPAIAEKIFDPFFTTKDVGQGTGLGLSISQGIVRENHGTITVESTPGQGATFRVRLPMRRED